MAFLTLYNRHRQLLSLLPRSNLSKSLHPDFRGNRCFSTRTEPNPLEFTGRNAYELLGVSETSSFTEIKASFRKLAKETHPDLAPSPDDSSASHRFVQILAAYEILSVSEKRAHYDRYLLSQRTLVQRRSRQGSIMYKYESPRAAIKQMEVVEWLRWYRCAINDILSEKRVVVGSGYFDALERDFYSAIHAAYYGPEIDSLDLLPNCFEAEERSAYDTSEVLHFVSGRDLFGMVCISDKVPQLSHTYPEKLTSFASGGSTFCKSTESGKSQVNPGLADHRICQMHTKSFDDHISDAYKDLELHVSGRVVAMATRVPPQSNSNGIQNEDSQDHIHVYLNSREYAYAGQGVGRDSSAGVADGSKIQLGTIAGLGTSTEEGSCFVYNDSGLKTHVIMKHRTLLTSGFRCEASLCFVIACVVGMVLGTKTGHLHGTSALMVSDGSLVWDVRPSLPKVVFYRFWLFEPRCGMHDTGGWYVETFGRDKKGRTIPSQRYWDGFDTYEHFEKRLHPAIYLLTLGYRTLDMEEAKRRKQTVKDNVEGQMSGVFRLWKKLM
ncbi:hypothetical protein RJ639_003676 [Escallonia herrerae]|uniref:J domain-containing protein n=1 Tax=Escallonia herrerae TaxID=1293975 RepID=A0AA89AUW9_9ASTE|nr:hypothetical protein RJ639_003676 [Escallonia herrerae]